MIIRILALAVLAPLALLAACSSGDNATTTPKPAATTAHAAASGAPGATAAPQAVTITAKDFSLSPATITASPGQVINLTLTNTGAVEHSFTVGSTDVAEASGGATKTGSFTATTGETEFHCKYHPSTMKGTIAITASSQNLGSATAAPAGVSGYGY